MAQTDVLDYIRQTPHNSNVNVVKGMLDSSGKSSLPEVTTEDNGDILTVVDGEWEKAEPGFKCTTETSTTTCFDGSLTTSSMGDFYGAQFTLSQPIEGDSITVTLNGTEYELPKVTLSFGIGYGELDENGLIFTNYPCAVTITSDGAYFFTPSANTYTVKIEDKITTETIETSECFDKAIKRFSLKYVKDYTPNNGGVVENLVVGASIEGQYDPATEETANKASGKYSHAEGGIATDEYGGYILQQTIASGDSSHAEGANTTASGTMSHAEGFSTKAIGDYSHAEGSSTKAIGDESHAEGSNTTASGDESHTEGSNTTASGVYSHAEGNMTTASGNESHAEGFNTTASGDASHAEGSSTTASGNESHAEGYKTIAKHKSQHVFGEWSAADPSTAATTERGTYIEIVGNGTSEPNRKNARTLDWDGNETLAGSLTLGNTTLTEAQLQQLLALLN